MFGPIAVSIAFRRSSSWMGDTAMFLQSLPLEDLVNQDRYAPIDRNASVVPTDVPQPEHNTRGENGALAEQTNLFERLWDLQRSFPGSEVHLQRVGGKVGNLTMFCGFPLVFLGQGSFSHGLVRPIVRHHHARRDGWYH